MAAAPGDEGPVELEGQLESQHEISKNHVDSNIAP
jgi:hypothetical protein